MSWSWPGAYAHDKHSMISHAARRRVTMSWGGCCAIAEYTHDRTCRRISRACFWKPNGLTDHIEQKPCRLSAPNTLELSTQSAVRATCSESIVISGLSFNRVAASQESNLVSFRGNSRFLFSPTEPVHSKFCRHVLSLSHTLKLNIHSACSE